MSLHLPYDAPFENSMQIYRSVWQYVVIKMTIPYAVPNGYSIRFAFISATIQAGTAYANF